MYICSTGESIDKDTRSYGKESKNPEICCLTPSCNSVYANTSKCHLVQGLSRYMGPLFSQSPVEM